MFEYEIFERQVKIDIYIFISCLNIIIIII